MVKQILTKLLISTVLITGTVIAYAQELSFGYGLGYVFKPNEPQELANNFFFQIKAKCKIKATDKSNDILAKMLSGSGVLNSNNLNTGEQIVLTVRDNDNLYIVAPSGTKVRMTNLGLHDVTANCSLI